MKSGCLFSGRPYFHGKNVEIWGHPFPVNRLPHTEIWGNHHYVYGGTHIWNMRQRFLCIRAWGNTKKEMKKWQNLWK